jgi:type IV pilus assembly protein PilV
MCRHHANRRGAFKSGGLLMHHLTSPRRARGFTMIEILVTLVVTAIGMLGLAGFVVRATTLSTDSIQRGRAAMLVNDMAARISDSKAIAPSFVKVVGNAPQLFGASVASCAGLAGADLQLCQWNNLLAGANDGGSGARFLGYRGCVTQPNPADPLYVVTVTWGSLTPGAPPADQCGAGVFGDESQRRVLRLQVRVANLIA